MAGGGAIHSALRVRSGHRALLELRALDPAGVGRGELPVQRAGLRAVALHGAAVGDRADLHPGRLLLLLCQECDGGADDGEAAVRRGLSPRTTPFTGRGKVDIRWCQNGRICGLGGFERNFVPAQHAVHNQGDALWSNIRSVDAPRPCLLSNTSVSRKRSGFLLEKLDKYETIIWIVYIIRTVPVALSHIVPNLCIVRVEGMQVRMYACTHVCICIRCMYLGIICIYVYIRV